MMKGRFSKFFDVWYNPDSILNILSFSEVTGRFRVTMDSGDSDSIFVHLDDG